MNHCVRIVLSNRDGSKTTISRPRVDGTRKLSFEDKRLSKRMKARLGLLSAV